MNILSEKLQFRQESGALHFFRLGNKNFIYERAKNLSFLIDDKVFLSLKTNSLQDKDVINDVEKLLFQINRINTVEARYATVYLPQFPDLIRLKELFIKVLADYKTAELFYDNGDLSLHSFGILEYQKLVDKFTYNGEYQLTLSLDQDKILNMRDLKYFIGKGLHLAVYGSVEKMFHFFGKFKNIKGIFNIVAEHKDQNIIEELLKNTQPGIRYFFQFAGEDKISLSRWVTNQMDVSENLPKIANIGAIFSYLYRDHTTIRDFIVFDPRQGIFHKFNNNSCSKCWARHICWATKSYSAFYDYDIGEIGNNANYCNAIRDMVESCIATMHQLEEVKNTPQSPSSEDIYKIHLINP
jgi:hypothetical protein